MDGFLPPVDLGGWAEYQRRRLEQLARQRIAAAAVPIGGAVGAAGDWLGQASQRIDDLLPDWATAQQAPAPVPEPPAPPPPPPPPEPAAPAPGVTDWARAAADRIGAIGQAIPSARGLEELSQRTAAGIEAQAQRAQAERPGDPFAVPRFAATQAAGAIGRAQGRTRQAIETMAGFGPTGADLAAQLGAGVQVGTTPFVEPGRVAADVVGGLGAPPEVQAVAQGAQSVAGPGGTLWSLTGGRVLPALGAVTGALGGVGTGIASGAPPEEVITRGFEGSNVGAGLGELLTAVPRYAPGVARLPGRVGQAAREVYGGTFGVVPRQTADAAERRLADAYERIPARDLTAEPFRASRGASSPLFLGQSGTFFRLGGEPHETAARGVLDALGKEATFDPLLARRDAVNSAMREGGLIRVEDSGTTVGVDLAGAPTPQQWEAIRRLERGRTAVFYTLVDPETLKVRGSGMGTRDLGADLTARGWAPTRAPDLDAAGEGGLGIRRGQRGLRVPRLTPEQQAQRAADGAAEQRMFEAMQLLQRRGLSEEADDLRLYALGKGEAGEGYARAIFAQQKLSDAYPRPTVDLPNGPGFEDAARVDVLRSGPATLISQGGRTLGPDDVIEVYHATSPDTAAAMVTNGVQPGGKVRRARTVIENEAVARMLGKRVGDVLDYEPGVGLGDGLYVGAAPETLSQYGDAVVGVRIKVGDLLAPPERPRGSAGGALLNADGYLNRAVDAADIRLVSGGTGPVAPGGVGIAPTQTADGGLLGAAQRAAEPFMARAAQTPGERALDIGAGVVGGVAGAATAPEDATPQERLERGLAGTALGALGGAHARQLGRVLQGTGADVLGAASKAAGEGAPLPRFDRLSPDDLHEYGGVFLYPDGSLRVGELGSHQDDAYAAGFTLQDLMRRGLARIGENADTGQRWLEATAPLTAAQRNAVRALARRGTGFVYEVQGRTGEGLEGFLKDTAAPGRRGGDVLGIAAGAAAGNRPAPARGRVAGVGLSDIPSIMASVPLMSPTSLGANLSSGAVRSMERVLGRALALQPVEALVDAAAMAREVPGATRRLGAAVRKGPTALNAGLSGAPVRDDLATRGGVLPTALTIGTRLNAATDQFWRELNQAGAGAVARRRGMSPLAAADYRIAAGDFATFGGSNTALAKKLTDLKGALHDPEASPLDRVIAGVVTTMTPYVMMPERLLKAAFETLAPVGSLTGAVKAFRAGDRAAARELAGRAAVAIPAWIALGALYQRGGLTGPPPQDTGERRRLEAQGAQWNTLEGPGGARIPLRYLGSFGQGAGAFASIMDAAKRAEAKGADPGAVWEARGSELLRWTLDESYLSDLVAFGEDVSGGRGVQSLRNTAAGAASRFTAPVAGVLSAADPLEREAEGFPALVASRAGARALLPARIDPTTGEPQVRRGTGWSRYWGERGDVTSPEATELARLGLQPRTFSPTEEYAGTKQTGEQRRVLQQAFGSETGRALRETVDSPKYRAADDEGKKRLLQAALRRATEEADVAAGERVGRDAKSQAERAYAAVPRFVGVQGTPDEVRRENARIQRAMTLAAEYRQQYGEGPWRSKMAQEEPEAFKLVNTPRVPAELLKRQRERLEQQYGVDLG